MSSHFETYLHNLNVNRYRKPRLTDLLGLEPQRRNFQCSLVVNPLTGEAYEAASARPAMPSLR